MKDKLESLQRDREELNEIISPYVTKRNKIQAELEKIADQIKSYAVELFDIEYEEDIGNYERTSPNNNDVHIDYIKRIVWVQSDNPRTNHPYDRHDNKYNLDELLEELT